MKTTLEIPDQTFRQAKAKASAMGIPLREYVTQVVEQKLSNDRKTGFDCRYLRTLSLFGSVPTCGGTFRHGNERGFAIDRCRRIHLRHSPILNIDITTSRHIAAIRLELKLAGKPIPVNDLWIAALARQHALAVLSRDAHFDSVAGLRRQSW